MFLLYFWDRVKLVRVFLTWPYPNKAYQTCATIQFKLHNLKYAYLRINGRGF